MNRPEHNPFSRMLAASLGAWICLLSTLSIHAAEPATPEADSQLAIRLEAISRMKGMDIESSPALKSAVMKVVDAVKGTAKFVEVVTDFNLKEQSPALLDYATLHPAESAGVEAVRFVLANGDESLWATRLAATNAAGLVEALGNSTDKLAVPLLQPIVTDTKRDVALRRAVVTALAQTQEGAAALLGIVKDKKLPADLKLAATSALHSLRWEDLKTQAIELLPPLQSKNSEPLPPINDLLTRKGDAKAGAEVFRRETVACIKCHTVNGEGVDFGPNLSEIGTKLGKDAIYTAILDPSAGISFGFEAWSLELKNGNEAFGLLVSETADEIAFKVQGGIVTRYKKADIERRTMGKLSIMPAGLQQAMSTQDIVDLVEYLASLKTAAPKKP